MSSCTRNVGINADELDYFLESGNATAFRDFLVKRFPLHQETINEFFNAFAPAHACKGLEDQATKKIQTMFDDERRNLLNLLLLPTFKEKFSEWANREDIPADVRKQISEWLASI